MARISTVNSRPAVNNSQFFSCQPSLSDKFTVSDARNNITTPECDSEYSPVNRCIYEQMIPVDLDVKGLCERIRRWRAQRLSIAIVPTMGALHDGHLSLVDAARSMADRVVVSIYVNPTQFAPGEDLASYPSDNAGDLTKLKQQKANSAYVPNHQEMYPDGFATTVHVGGPALAGLEDRFRPHFFGGVSTVVAKLLIQARCDYAMFGEKDYQQLKVVTRMARDLNIATKIIGVPTVREVDGLAMSSRNSYLSAADRKVAPQLYETLQTIAVKLREGDEPAKVIAAGKRVLQKSGFSVDYVEARNAESLTIPENAKTEPVRLLAAAKLGKTRLIDNIAV